MRFWIAVAGAMLQDIFTSNSENFINRIKKMLLIIRKHFPEDNQASQTTEITILKIFETN